MKFEHNFPFMSDKREGKEAISEPKHEDILNLLVEETVKRIDPNKKTYLFHSAGKDSNSIALALAEAGWQNKITCISHKSKGDKDESEISKKIATKLGFKHQKIYEPKSLEKKDIDSINYYFENIPLPCMDNVALAYPLYATQIEFQDTNIIDGMGNDVYMGHIPNSLEYNRQKTFSKFHHLRPLFGKLNSGTRFEIATATKCEWAGLFGITYGDTNKILNNSYDVYKYWKLIDIKRTDLDYFDFRASLRGALIDQEIFTRKVRNFSDTVNSNLILPFTNQKVAQYFSKLPEKYLFNRKEFKNKLILRKILKERIDLDSDKLGKMAYEFDFYSILMMMKRDVDNEIFSCKLWNKEGIEKVLNNLYKKINSIHRLAEKVKALVQRLYLISAWHNKNRYVKE
jgi:asparagine synthase (glutamine-hydrolysing)